MRNRKQLASNPFLGSLRQVAIAIGKKEKIEIVFEGSGAKTDGRIICLPKTLPADSKEVEILLRGYLDHEVGHIKHTMFNLPSPAHPLVQTLTNIVEDIRIEQEMGREYPGSAVNLRESIKYLRDSGEIKVNKSITDPIGAYLMGISYGARVKHLRNDLREEAEELRKATIKLLGQPAARIIDKAITSAGHLDSTAEARELAEKVFDDLQKLLQPPPPQPPQQQPQSGNDSEQDQEQNQQQESGEGQGKENEEQNGGADKDQQDQDGNGSSSSEGQDDQTDGSGESQSNSNSGSADSNGADGQSSQEGGQDAPMSAKQSSNLEQLLDATEKELEKIEKKLDVGNQAAKAINDGCDSNEFEKNNKGLRDSSGGTGEVPTFASGAGGSTAGSEIVKLSMQTVGLRGKLAGLFQANKLKRSNPQMTGIKIDRRAVHLLAANTPDTRIFEQRREKAADSTAVVILIDRSGSMRCQIMTATSAAYSIAKAIEGMQGVTCTVGAFPANLEGGVICLKKFDEKPRSEKFAVGADGYTPTDTALRWAGQNIWPRQENRKIVLTLTDGQPDCLETAKSMAELLSVENGVECYGIGIGPGTGANVRSLFGEKSAKEITDIGQLADAMFDTLITAITR